MRLPARHPRRDPRRSLHKPAQQTVLPADAVPALLAPQPIPKLRGLGGTMGEQVRAPAGVPALHAWPLCHLPGAAAARARLLQTHAHGLLNSAAAACLQQVMGALGIETVGQLAATPLPRLEAAFGEKEARWLYGLARGVTGARVEGWLSEHRVRRPAAARC